MKKIRLLILLLSIGTLSISSFFTGCSSSNEDENNQQNETGGLFSENGTVIGSDSAQEIYVKAGDYTIKKGTYTLKGWVHLGEGVTVTIDAGTVIKGDKATKAALIADRGGKIIAKGTASEPIVFTSAQAAGSRKPGDWGGIILCGKAKINAQGGSKMIEGGPNSYYGGTDDADNSGTLEYVRIEFAGYPFKTDQEINGLTLGGVGSGTTLDHIQVSYSNDDSFEWFGGCVDAKYLIAYKGWDDDFDTDNGFSGKLQFLLGVRDPKIADQSLSNGFESDNDADGSSLSPYTSAVFSNVTLIGPKAGTGDFVNTLSYIDGGGENPNNGSRLGQFQAAMQIRRNSKLNCFNSVAIGWPVGLLIDVEKGNPGSLSFAENGDLKLNHLFFANMTALGSDVNKRLVDSLSTKGTLDQQNLDNSIPSNSHKFFLESGNDNTYYDDYASLKLSALTSIPSSLLSTVAGLNYVAPGSGSPLLSAASFTDSMLSDSFFSKVSYVGAFSGTSDDWAKGWTDFDPQNTSY